MKVLVVDDDRIFIFLSVKILEKMISPADILVANNGKEALDFLKKDDGNVPLEIPDLILLDINMPILDGFGFLEEFQALTLPKKVDVVMVSSSQDGNDMARARAMGAKNYLTKPLTTEKLESILPR